VGCDNLHGTVESNYQHHFSVNVLCGVIRDHLIGQYIFPQRLTGDIYAKFLQDELPAHLENFPPQTRRQMYYQRDGAPPHFSPVVRQYLNHKFPNRWIGRGGAQNWPPWSPDLIPLDYQVWGLFERYDVCTQGEHERRTTPANSQRCKKHQQRCSVS